MEGKVMKKIFFTLVLMLSMSLYMPAQRNDMFFHTDNDVYNRMDNPNEIGLHMPLSPLGSTNSESAPLGSGLIILTAIGAAYTIKKKHDKTV